MSETPPSTTPKELAAELGIDPKRIRSWLRSRNLRPEDERWQQWHLSLLESDSVREAFAAPRELPSDRAFDPSTLTVGEILHAYSALLTELRHRGLIRTSNAPIGDLAEYACASFYEGELAPNSEKSYDLVARDTRRIQVKVRNADKNTRPSAVFSSVRSTDFDACVFIIANPQTNSIEAAYEWTAEQVLTEGRFSAHTNSTLVRIGKVRAGNVGVDVTSGIAAAWQAMLGLTRERLLVR